MSIAPYYPPNSISQLPRGNLLWWSEDFTKAGIWDPADATVGSGISDPLGGTSANSLILSATGNDYIAQTTQATMAVAGLTFTFSIWAMAGTLPGSMTLFLRNADQSQQGAIAFTPTSSWQRYSITFTFPAGSTPGLLAILDPNNNLGTAGQTVLMFGAQLEPGPVVGTYVETGGASDYGIWGSPQGQSLSVLPLLPGQNPTVSKAPKWSTGVIRTASGRERRTSYWPSPLWQFELSYEVLRRAGASSKPTVDELDVMWEFYNSMQGQFGAFLAVDPNDCAIPYGAPQVFGVGDGSTKSFQLIRAINTWTEPVYCTYATAILDNGGPTVGYSTLLPNGVVTFATAPAVGHVLSWAGYFYFGCRFLQDDLSFDQIVDQLWSGKSLKFTSLRP